MSKKEALIKQVIEIAEQDRQKEIKEINKKADEFIKNVKKQTIKDLERLIWLHAILQFGSVLKDLNKGLNKEFNKEFNKEIKGGK